MANFYALGSIKLLIGGIKPMRALELQCIV